MAQGRVSGGVREGRLDRAAPATRLFAIDGRDAIAEPGSVRFFRPLGVGDRGDDVLQLKRILAAAGDNPGPMNTVFTEQTRFALAQWQAQHHYPGATPVSPQSVTVSLAQGSGYTLGKQNGGRARSSEPAAREQRRQRRASPHCGVLTALRSQVTALATPVLRIQSTNAVVSEGTPATFVITASESSATDITVNLTRGGTANAQRHRDAADLGHACR